MEMTDLVETIKMELGYPVVSVYIQDTQIETLVRKALRRCADKASPTFLFPGTVSGGMVSMEGTKVSAVRNIYSGLVSDSLLDNLNDNLINFMGYGSSISTGLGDNRFYDVIAKTGNISEMRKWLLYDYYLDGETLYVDNYSGTVTIEYTKKEVTLSDLDANWSAWVESYATALCKMVEGKIRGKYVPNNSPFTTNAEEMVSEGQSEKTDLESRLDMAMGYWNIMR